MPKWRVTVDCDLLIDAPSEEAACQQIDSLLRQFASVSVMGKLSLQARLLRSEDRQLLTKVPNVPKDRLLSLFASLSDIEQLVLACCVKPAYSHTVYTAVRKARPTVELSEIAQAISHLGFEGWLNTVKYDHERSVFPNLHTEAQYNAHRSTKDFVK